MHKDFYIFRHGETDYNKERRWQGCGIDIPLNQTGVAQAYLLQKKLAKIPLEIIYSSPLQRAVKTAQIVAEKKNIPVYLCSDLHEGNLGMAEGLLKTEAAETFPDIFKLWYDDEVDYWDITFPKGETKRQIFTRMKRALDSLLPCTEQCIGIATHGAAIRYLFLGMGVRLGRLENCALFHLVYDDGIWILSEQ